MNKRTFWNIMQLLLAIAIFPWGLNQAAAGPGGGTYYANSPAGGASGTALRKFVDSLPGVGAANKNNLGNYIPIATPITGRAGVPNDGDYYEIGVVEYSQKMHSDLPKKTRLRGYRDLSPAFTNMSTQYLGPLIIAKRDRPVRVKLTNLLPSGPAGNLFLPVDTSLMGAGMGPLTAAGTACDPMALGANCAQYPQNRATFHLHGGNSPWISDGTPHQWTVPAAEVTPYKKGVSTRDVPDMPASGDGSMTFYWTNQQSNRLMFYHDHSLGLTRLNVYAGEAAGYLLTDPVEENLINTGVLPNLGGVYRYGIPLIIQDKTFVPQNIDTQDALWTKNSQGAANNWGSYGDLWFPHVYETNQDPTSPAGANPFGRWDYGPWFWPPISVAADKSVLPEPSTTPEAFMDTMLVNGTAYPYLTVEPKPYRFRILNACNDRFLNLSLFYSDPNDPSGKEVKMVPAAPNPAYPAGPFPTEAVWPTDGRNGGVPDPLTRGPKIIQIGSESGFLPYPAVHPNQPVNFNYNRRDIVVLNVQEKNLFMGPAERGDVIIDFSQVPPGSTIILYNDAPAPVPAGDPRQDYYTGNPDQSATGGAPSTMRGFGPNTRTIMQFRVAGVPAAPFNLANLQAALPVAFQNTQPAPLVPEPTYPAASGGYAPGELYAKIQDYSISFTPIGSTVPTTIPFQPKAIQELWDGYGRMNATLGVELPFTTGRNQTTIPMGYAEPPTERIIDGHAQIWKITHNGVDTHPVHFHMFDVQIINRVGWDGAIRPPDDNELGWKETVRMNPLEDIIVALRPKAQTLPFSQPTSTRALDPTLPATALIATTDIVTNPLVGTAVTVPNVPAANPLGYDYGYEYVWHCHILGHEENDFMRAVVFAVSTTQAPQPTGLAAYKGGDTVPGLPNYVNAYINSNINQIILQWADGAPFETPSYFRVERRIGGGAFLPLTTISFLSGYPPIFNDTSVAPNTTYSYRVFAVNALGDSLASNTATVTTANWPAATSVTLTPSKPSPHIEGTNVQFSAAAVSAPLVPNPSNLSVAYQYRFWLNGVIVQDFSNRNIWTLPDTTPVGTYVIKVDARTSSTQNPLATLSINYQVVTPPTAPITLPSPVPGIYTAAPVTVTLSASGPAPIANIYYTLDGSIPTTASPIYTVPIVLNATTTINYFAVDINGVAETVKTDTWAMHTADLAATIQINNGAAATNNTAVTLKLSAFDPVGIVSMQFSNDNITYTAEEPYLTTKAWTLTAGDGLKTVYVRFRDKSLPQPGGFLYPPVTAQIVLDTVAPITAVSPIPGTYTPVSVTLTPNEAATIYYTIDGSTPTTASTVYTVPILLVANTTIKFFAVDTAGNAEAVQSGSWNINIPQLSASVQINNGAGLTNSSTVSLALSATTTNTGGSITGMQFSNDGTNYSAIEPYAATRAWTLAAGDGLKTVYVRFIETNTLGTIPYQPVTANITLDQTPAITTAGPIAGIYASTVPVALTTNEPATIYYTTDGTLPTNTSTVYAGPISVAATTTIRYFAVDTAGNSEPPKSGTWTIQAPDLVSSMTINNGATHTHQTSVLLNLTATSSTGVTTMKFSNDGVQYTAEEPFATSRVWTLVPGDGLKTVYVQFRDGAGGGGTLYPPVTAQITLDTVLPVTTAGPITGSYAVPPLTVTLSANEPAVIHYTTDGSIPTTASPVYSGPLTLASTTTIKYFAVDTAGNIEPVNSGTWSITGSDLTASILINNGASATNNSTVTLTLNAFDPVGIDTMQFSNDGINYSAEEPYAASKVWSLVPGDGAKTVYVRFRDLTLPTGQLYPPITAQIMLDTVPPVTATTPVAGTYSVSQVNLTMSASETATTYYTIDGSTPTTASPVYSAPITLAASTTVKYFSVDTAGNVEAVKSGFWSIHESDLVASVKINNGGAYTNKSETTLTLSAVDPLGVNTMQFSNDGFTYSAEEPYATSKVWTLIPGDGVRTVYVRFRDGSLPTGNLYAPVTATVTVKTTPPALAVSSYVQSAALSTRNISGTMEAGATLTVSAPAGISHQLTPPNGATSWSLDLSGLPVASSPINLVATDPAGNTTTINITVTRVADVPDAPVINIVAPGNAEATVAFTANFDGGSPITSYTVVSSPGGITATGPASPLLVSGLTNGTVYSFTVRATNVVGTGAASAVSTSIKPSGSIIPRVIITTPKPVNTLNKDFGQISFTGVNHLSFQCSLDKGVFVPCESPYTYRNISDGPHSFVVQAVNMYGAHSTSATYSWKSDTTSPVGTMITKKPAQFTGLNSATFAFKGQSIGLTYECQLDTDPFAACSMTKTYTALGNGSHTFSVRARDAAGNIETQPASYTWTIDAAAPDTAILSGPADGSTTSGSVVFTFNSDKPDTTFECRLDNASYAACISPYIKTLKPGAHAFSVRAKRKVGPTPGAFITDATPATVIWNTN